MKFGKKKWFIFLREHFSFGKSCLVAFVIFIIFIDENSCIQQTKYDKEIDRLNQLIKEQNDTTEHYNNLVKELTTDKKLVEKIAREQFLMCKPNEHIYVIETTPNTK